MRTFAYTTELCGIFAAEKLTPNVTVAVTLICDNNATSNALEAPR